VAVGSQFTVEKSSLSVISLGIAPCFPISPHYNVPCHVSSMRCRSIALPSILSRFLGYHQPCPPLQILTILYFNPYLLYPYLVDIISSRRFLSSLRSILSLLHQSIILRNFLSKAFSSRFSCASRTLVAPPLQIKISGLAKSQVFGHCSITCTSLSLV